MSISLHRRIFSSRWYYYSERSSSVIDSSRGGKPQMHLKLDTLMGTYCRTNSLRHLLQHLQPSWHCVSICSASEQLSQQTTHLCSVMCLSGPSPQNRHSFLLICWPMFVMNKRFLTVFWALLLVELSTSSVCLWPPSVSEMEAPCGVEAFDELTVARALIGSNIACKTLAILGSIPCLFSVNSAAPRGISKYSEQKASIVVWKC